MEMLCVEHVSKHYAGHTALDDVSLTVPRGSVYGLLGPNGAGKTTLIRIINRITAPDSGCVRFEGHPIAPDDVRQIGYLPEERGLYRKMKVGEQAIFFARLKGLSRRDAMQRLQVWFEKFGIESWWNKRVEELSKGMAQKVQFIVTVLHEPRLLIFDEPFSGFDPINADLLRREILALRDRGATVIFSTHNMSSVEEICDHITLINKSHDILSGTVGDIRRRHGNNVFDLSFRGCEQTLRTSLEGLCEVLDTPGQPDATPGRPQGAVAGQTPDAASGAESGPASGCSSLRIRVADAAGVRAAIAAANEAVELRSFAEVIPSMNDIFIRAVAGTL